jgi:hypothetical protein
MSELIKTSSMDERTMFGPEDDQDIIKAIRFIQEGTGWGRVELVIKDGKLEDINTTINKRQGLKRPH